MSRAEGIFGICKEGKSYSFDLGLMEELIFVAACVSLIAAMVCDWAQPTVRLGTAHYLRLGTAHMTGHSPL